MNEQLGWPISIEGVSKTFGQDSARPTHALSDVSMQIQPGEFVSLLGRSGCGKTTLLRIIGGLEVPTAGGVSFQPPAGTVPTRPRFGFAFQDANLLPWRTVRDNIALPLEINNVARLERLERSTEYANNVHLGSFLDHLPKQLSGGMAQRVALARSFVDSPEVLLMDEPFGALDAMTRESMNMLLGGIWMRHRSTVVLVTHSIQESVLLSSRVFVMTPSPGQINTVVEVKLPFPRTVDMLRSAEFAAAADQIRSIINQ